ncbi:hypothetical protein RND71_043475 [Anisodus tanguticus]|uniref:AMP-dependent synthetase/ligase domain-containing protein n=1 Tax=Anisodus tanguticus TaxID=243964 RepID=A0AAE1UTK2_9SOLA|nr:hypothetical protein RND71_043475 [Anisodus tanguticus]
MKELLRINDTELDLSIFECQTISELFCNNVKRFGSRKCLGYREVFGEEDEKQADGKIFRKLILGDYKWLTYNDVNEKVNNLAKGFYSYGVRPGDTVMIFAETKAEWLISAYAVFKIGAHIATLYATLSQDAIIHGINETEVTHLVTSYDLLPKLESAFKDIPKLTTIFYFDGHKKINTPTLGKCSVVSLSYVENIGKESKEEFHFQQKSKEDTAIIMYTSGSTGVPKGVVLSHNNVLCTIRGFYPVVKNLHNAVNIAYLPLAHVFELAAESYFIAVGVPIGYSSPHTMTNKSTAIKKGNLGDASILKPTVMAAVPLVLDRIRKNICEEVSAKHPFLKELFNFLISYKKFWTKRGFKTPIVNMIVCNKIRSLVGGRIQHIVTGSAPLSPETHDYIRACLDVILIQGYGLTETAAGATLMDFEDFSNGRVGAPLNGVPIRLIDWGEGNYHTTDKPYPRGEIVIGGDCVTSGYYKNDDLTKEAFFEENGKRWFKTGDIGEIYPDGTIKIIDRKKDLVKLQFGEYISLGKVETELKSCSFVDNICVYGDSYHSYIIALIVPNIKALKLLAKQLNKESLTHTEMCRDQEIIKEVAKTLKDHAMNAGLLKNEIPTKIMLVTEDWTPDSGLVTAALKLRRKNIQEKYKMEINKIDIKTYNELKLITEFPEAVEAIKIKWQGETEDKPLLFTWLRIRADKWSFYEFDLKATTVQSLVETKVIIDTIEKINILAKQIKNTKCQFTEEKSNLAKEIKIKAGKDNLEVNADNPLDCSCQYTDLKRNELVTAKKDDKLELLRVKQEEVGKVGVKPVDVEGKIGAQSTSSSSTLESFITVTKLESSCLSFK